jgi:hypothetical protein
VIAPSAGRMHSQSGRPADEFCRSIIRAVPRFLRPGGFCQMVTNWIRPAAGNEQERLVRWFADLGCDTLVLHSHTEDAATYARRRISELTDDPDEAGRLFDEWTAHYVAEGIAGISFGVMTLRRTAGRASWFRYEPLPSVGGPCGPSIAAWFRRQDFLADRPGDKLLAAHVRRVDDVSTDGNGRMRRSTGLMFAGAADRTVRSFVDRCSGNKPLADEMTQLAKELGRDPPAFVPEFLAVVRRLIEAGILVPT